MPVSFPVLQPSGEIVYQDCLTVAELAAQLHTTRGAVYDKIHHAGWPYMQPVRRIYFTPEHVRLILAMIDHGRPGPQSPPSPTRGQGSPGNVRKIRGA
jgi:hypothetical protein